MPHNRDQVRLHLHHQQAELLARQGPGSWEADTVETVAPDGRAALIALIVPLKRPAGGTSAQPPPAHPPPETDVSTGRPVEVARPLLEWVRAHPDCRHSEILSAMEDAGFSRTAASDNLRVLVRLGLILHPVRGGPYRAAT